MTNGSPPPTYWIGANLLLASKWTWTTNDTALFTNWAPDEPADPSNFDCGSVRSDTYLWKKELCYSARPFVCTSAPSNDPGNSPCPPGYTQYADQCYKLFQGLMRLMNYYDSNAFCLQQNATLPKIPSLTVQDFLYSFIAPGKSHIWLGMVCGGKYPGACVWSDGTPITYSNFEGNNECSPSPFLMDINSGGWFCDWDFWPDATAVVCVTPAH